jgi:hypothetical protein
MQLDRQCLLNGCQLARAGQLAAESKIMLDQALAEKRETLSGALWCDLGEHAFSSRDRKRATYKIQTLDEETGQPVEDQLTACGPHAAERQMQLTRKPISPPPGADQQLYTEFLEWKAGQRADVPSPDGP